MGQHRADMNKEGAFKAGKGGSGGGVGRGVQILLR